MGRPGPIKAPTDLTQLKPTRPDPIKVHYYMGQTLDLYISMDRLNLKTHYCLAH